MILGFYLLALAKVDTDFGLATPVRLKAGSEYVDVTHGHAVPNLVDFRGDGKKELLVGQFQDGTMRIYENSAPKGEPKLTTFSYFQAGGATARVPYG